MLCDVSCVGCCLCDSVWVSGGIEACQSGFTVGLLLSLLNCLLCGFRRSVSSL